MSSIAKLRQAAESFAERNSHETSSSRLSASISKKLFECSDSGLALRMLMQQALHEGTAHRARFATDVFCKAGAEWAALPFARKGIIDTESRWQIRRANQVEDAERPAECMSHPITLTVNFRGDVENVTVSDQLGRGQSDVLTSAPEDLADQVLKLLSEQPFRFLNDVVVLQIDETTDSRAERAIEDLGRLLPLLPAHVLCVGNKFSMVEFCAAERGFPLGMHFVANDSNGVTYLGDDSGATWGRDSHTVKSLRTLKQVAALLNLQHASRILSQTNEKSVRDRLAGQLLTEFGSESQFLETQALATYARDILPVASK